MKPHKPIISKKDNLYRSRLDHVINTKHELAQLSQQIDWDHLTLMRAFATHLLLTLEHTLTQIMNFFD